MFHFPFCFCRFNHGVHTERCYRCCSCTSSVFYITGSTVVLWFGLVQFSWAFLCGIFRIPKPINHIILKGKKSHWQTYYMNTILGPANVSLVQSLWSCVFICSIFISSTVLFLVRKADFDWAFQSPSNAHISSIIKIEKQWYKAGKEWNEKDSGWGMNHFFSQLWCKM